MTDNSKHWFVAEYNLIWRKHPRLFIIYVLAKFLFNLALAGAMLTVGYLLWR